MSSNSERNGRLHREEKPKPVEVSRRTFLLTYAGAIVTGLLLRKLLKPSEAEQIEEEVKREVERQFSALTKGKEKVDMMNGFIFTTQELLTHREAIVTRCVNMYMNTFVSLDQTEKANREKKIQDCLGTSIMDVMNSH